MKRILNFYTALLRADTKDIILQGKDKVKAIKFSYHKMASPSLSRLWDENVSVRNGIYAQTINFQNLTGQEIVDKIKAPM